jgi:hypothetical protein
LVNINFICPYSTKSCGLTLKKGFGNTGLAQPFLAAVSQAFEPAAGFFRCGFVRCQTLADWKVGDTAGWKACATGPEKEKAALSGGFL